jgi:hypothetical protein
MRCERHPIGPLIDAARVLPLDTPARVLAAVAGIVAAGVDQPAVVVRALARAGVAEADWRAVVARALEPEA